MNGIKQASEEGQKEEVSNETNKLLNCYWTIDEALKAGRLIQHGTQTVGFYSFTKGAVELMRVEVVSSHMACERYLRENDPEVPEEMFLTNLIREEVRRFPFLEGGHWMIDAGRPMFRELPFVQIATVESHQTGIRYLVLLLPEEWSPALFVRKQ